MSYCRWSSDAFRCDLYAWEDFSGKWIIAVASGRYVIPDDTKEPDFRSPTFAAEYEALMRVIRNAETVRIGLPHDGERIECDSEAEMYAEMLRLAELGYQVPDRVLADAMEAVAR